MTRVYIVSSWENQEFVLQLAQILERRGLEVDAFCRPSDDRYSFRWPELLGSSLLQHDAVTVLTDPRIQRAFHEEKQWLDWADAIVMVMPCGRSSHLEGGYAKGQGKRLYLYGNFPKGEFDLMHGFADGVFRTWQLERLIAALKDGDV